LQAEPLHLQLQHLPVNLVQSLWLAGDLHLELGSSLINKINCLVRKEPEGQSTIFTSKKSELQQSGSDSLLRQLAGDLHLQFGSRLIHIALSGRNLQSGMKQ
jgi:hypothetical protein